MSSSFSVFFQSPTIVFVRLASPNGNVGSYGKKNLFPIKLVGTVYACALARIALKKSHLVDSEQLCLSAE